MQLSLKSVRQVAFLGCTLLSANSALAHGYLVNSRAHLCHLTTNINCGAIQWEPQSVEGLDRYPETGPQDGQIAAAANPTWSALNEQNLGRWSKIKLNAGAYTFQWQFTAPHVTRDIRYWITKADWNPNAPISRAQFEAQPFCQFSYHSKPPVPSTSVRANHLCTLPARTGYHLILSVWDVADTVNSFYSIMDGNFDSGPPTALNQVGTIIGSSDLPVGASAATRVFNKDGEVPALAASVNITAASDGLASKWPRLLAQAVNAKNNGLQAGVLNGGVVTPQDGTNNIYVPSDSLVTRVEIATKLPPTDPGQENNFGINNLSATNVVNGQTQISMTLMTSIAQTVDIKLANKTKDFGVIYHLDSLTGSKMVTQAVSGVAAGEYDLIMVTSFMKNGQKQIAQKSFKLNLTASSGNLPVYPAGIGSYVAGSKVQGRDGKSYTCKPWPYTTWCNGQAQYYEPGVGSAWQQAWEVSALR